MKKTKEYNHPLNAEKYMYSDFTEWKTVYTDSKIVEGLSAHEDKIFFICPKCKNSNDGLEFSIVYECDCGISVQKLGLALYLWE